MVPGNQARLGRHDGRLLRKALANTKAPKTVVLGGCGSAAGTNPATWPAEYRYGLASALLEDGYYSFQENGDYKALPWYDEGDAPLGTAAEAPPTAPTSSGIWMRRYTNGLSCWSTPARPPPPRSTSVLATKHLPGKKDTVVNNGLPVSTVTLQPRSGLLLVKQ